MEGVNGVRKSLMFVATSPKCWSYALFLVYYTQYGLSFAVLPQTESLVLL